MFENRLIHYNSNPAGVGTTVEISEIETLAKGTIIAGDGSGAPTTLTAGANNLPLVADSAQTAGLKYAVLPVAGGGSGAETLTGIVKGNGTSAMTAVTAPSGDLVGTTDTQTLTNKRVPPRVTTETSSATPTINTDNTDVHSITALAAAVTSMTTNLSGTPTNGQKLLIRFKDDGTGRAITWGASFEARGTALPTTTVASKVLTVGFVYDTVTSKWGCVASAQEA